MHVTLSIIKADIGSIGGHVTPSERLVNTVSHHIGQGRDGLLTDYFVGYTGDDIALLLVHQRGVGNPEVHRLAWDAFKAGTAVAQAQGLYGAGQDLLVDSFSGNVKGMGPAVAEMEFDERPNEPFLMFLADRRLQPAALPGLRRSDEHRRSAAQPGDQQGVPLPRHGRELHRGRSRYRAVHAGAALRAGRPAAGQ